MQTQTLPTGRSKRSSWHALLLRMQIRENHTHHISFFIYLRLFVTFLMKPFDITLCVLFRNGTGHHNAITAFHCRRVLRILDGFRSGNGRSCAFHIRFRTLWPVSFPAYRKPQVRFPVPQASTSDGRNQLGSRKTLPCSWHRETSGKTRAPRQPRQQCFAATPSSAGW